MANVLIVTSSFRKNSNSTELAAHVAEGARSKGHTVAGVDIARLAIGPCRGCQACLLPDAEGCVNKDDMQKLYPLVREADILLYASPIYWFTLCGQIKQFMDRCFAVAVPKDSAQPSPFAAKKLGAVFVYGDEDPFVSGCVNAIRTVQDICAYTGAAWAGALYGSAHEAGAIKNNAALLEKAVRYGASL